MNLTIGLGSSDDEDGVGIDRQQASYISAVPLVILEFPMPFKCLILTTE